MIRRNALSPWSTRRREVAARAIRRDAVRLLLSAALLVGGTACTGGPRTVAGGQDSTAAPSTATATPSAATGAVDSVISRDSLIARFRAGTTAVTAFSGGATSRDALVTAWAKAMRTKDLAAFPTLALTKDEFAWLYYPTNPQGLPPYDLAPALMWFMLEGQSRKGLGRALEERGGPQFRFAGYTCAADSSQQGENTVWGPCEIRRVQAAGDTVTERLFGLIVRRGRTYKFVGYQNKL